MIYTRSSKTRYYTKEENQKFKSDIKEYRKMRYEQLGVKHPVALLLDSSLITRTTSKKYSHKIIKCGDYYQIYNYGNIKQKNENNLEKIKSKKIEETMINIINDKNNNLKGIDILNNLIQKSKEGEVTKNDIDTNFLFKPDRYKDYSVNIKTKKEIEYKNIIRSKFELQRLVKSNENKFNTFITLTFSENITDIKIANKKFDNWRRMIKRKKSDFLYVCVPEFQKRGAVHYHLLTNLSIKENHDIIIPQKNKKYQYDVRYWNNGFSSVFNVKNINVVGYMTKYMTKDIDNRLWGRRRYLYSQNLEKPSTLYIDLDNLEDFKFLVDVINKTDKKYNNIYCDKFGEIIEFNEYKIKTE